MPRIAHLNPSEVAVLAALADYEYLTQAQLGVITGLAASAVSELLKRLRLYDLVHGLTLLRPAAFRLTHKGARLVEAPAPRERAYPAIQHVVHTAQAVLHVREEFPSARLLGRRSLYAHGLHPSVGEHAAQSEDGWIFLLVDDYLMRPGRVGDAWTRTHTPVGRYVDIHRLRTRGEFLVTRWCDAVRHYRVLTTDAQQVRRLTQAAARAEVPAQVQRMKPVWRLSR
jgi:hypothetical protein